MSNYYYSCYVLYIFTNYMGGGPRVVVSTAAFHARVRGSVPGLGGLKETEIHMFQRAVLIVLLAASYSVNVVNRSIHNQR